MKKGIILKLKRFKLLDYVTLNKIFIILCMLFIIGIVLGSTFLSKNSWIPQKTEVLFKHFLSVHKEQIFLKKLLFCFLNYIFVLILYFLSGTSMLGVATTPFIMVWQGILIGSITSYLYSSHGLSGIAFNAIILIPPISIFIICCCFSARYAIEFSINMAKLTMPKSRPASLYIEFKNYCGKFFILVGISLICSLIEIILNVLFLKFFNF